MAVVFEGRTSSNHNNSSTGTLDLPAGTAAGDVLVYVADSDGTNGMALLSGFTHVFGGPVAGSGGSFRGNFQYRVCDGTEPSSYATNSIIGERVAQALLRFSGVDNTTPIAASGNRAGNGTSALFNNDVSTTDAALVIAALCVESGNNGSPIVSSWPTGWTERYDNENGPPGGGNASATAAAATFDHAGGAIPSQTVSYSGGTSQYIAAYIALNPASEGGGSTITGTGAATIAPTTASGTAERAVTGSGAVETASATASGSASVSGAVDGSGAVILSAVTASGQAKREVTGTGAATIGATQASGAAQREVTGQGAASVAPVQAAGSAGSAGEVTGSGAATLPSTQAMGVAEREITGSGAPTLSVIQGSGSASSSSTVTATGAVQIAAVTASGVGERQVTSIGVVTLRVITADGTATVVSSGGRIGVWDGTAWIQRPVQHWNGTAWEVKPLKRWDGSAWVLTG